MNIISIHIHTVNTRLLVTEKNFIPVKQILSVVTCDKNLITYKNIKPILYIYIYIIRCNYTLIRIEILLLWRNCYWKHCRESVPEVKIHRESSQHIARLLLF